MFHWSHQTASGKTIYVFDQGKMFVEIRLLRRGQNIRVSLESMSYVGRH